MDKVLLTTVSNRLLEAKVLKKGDSYGRSAVWNYSELGVEFLDVTDPDNKIVTGCQYSASTMLNHKGGLCIHGGCREWDIPSEEFSQFSDWLGGIIK